MKGICFIKKTLLAVILVLIGSFALTLASASDVNAATSYYESEPNNYVSSADVISVQKGNSFVGTVGPNNVDWFKFTLSKGSVVQFNAKGTQSGASKLEFEYYLYKASNTDEELIRVDAFYNENLGYYYSHEKYYLTAGTYYVKIYSFQNTIPYVFSFPTVIAYENFTEPNDTVSQAIKLTNAKVYKGIIGLGNHYVGEDFDFFKVRVSTKGKYYISFKNTTTEGRFSPLLETVNANGDEVKRLDGSSWVETQDEGRIDILTTLPAGTTYFKIYSNYNYGSGKYTFSVTRKPTKVTGFKVIKKTSRKARLTWNSKSSVKGYKVYRSTKQNSGYKLLTTVKGASKHSYIDSTRKSGKEYYYKVCAYKYVNGHVCKGYFSKKIKK